MPCRTAKATTCARFWTWSLSRDVAQVVLERVFADRQTLRQLAITGDPLHQQVQHFAFALGEARRRLDGGRRRWRGARELAEQLSGEAGRQRGRALRHTLQQVKEFG